MLAKRGPAAGPQIERLDALAGPRAGSPPEHRGGRERDEAGARKDDLLKVDEEVEAVGDDPQRDQDERLDLADDDQEDQREGGCAEGPLGAVRERDIQQAHWRRLCVVTAMRASPANGQLVIGVSRSALARSRPCPPARRPSLRSSTDTPGPAAADAHGPSYRRVVRASPRTSRRAASRARARASAACRSCAGRRGRTRRRTGWSRTRRARRAW